MKCASITLDFNKPLVMGIVNQTDDSFYTGSRFKRLVDVTVKVEKMINDGAAIIDIGAVSSRPGANLGTEEEELKKLRPVLRFLVKTFPQTVFSVDTFRENAAKAAFEEGAGIINDISFGSLDPGMLQAVAETKLPYVLMHMQGTPANMQANPIYHDLIPELQQFFDTSLEKLNGMGIENVIIDPGFGFGKRLEQNYMILNRLPELKISSCPLMVGISRKSMIYKLLQISPEEALNGTSALHLLALLNGADILRVHDVKEASEIIRLAEMLKASMTT